MDDDRDGESIDNVSETSHQKNKGPVKNSSRLHGPEAVMIPAKNGWSYKVISKTKITNYSEWSPIWRSTGPMNLIPQHQGIGPYVYNM